MKFWRGYLLAQWGNVQHKFWVAYYMNRLRPWIPEPLAWTWRALKHDWSKFKWDEASYFARTIFDLKHSSYGSDEYRALLKEIRPAIQRHYERHDHHPEHWIKDGEFVGHVWERMPRIAQLEMICDWAAAVRRHKDGDLRKSFEINAERWAMSRGQRAYLESYAELGGFFK